MSCTLMESSPVQQLSDPLSSTESLKARISWMDKSHYSKGRTTVRSRIQDVLSCVLFERNIVSCLYDNVPDLRSAVIMA